jgi:hypothetical protein
MKRTSITIKAAWITGIMVIIAALITGLFTVSHKNEEPSQNQNVNITGKDSSKISYTNNQNEIKGDYINGNKVVIKNGTQKVEPNSKVVAPKALIVTNNQSGGNNTVNINQMTSQSYQPISKEINDQVNKNLTNLKIKYPNAPIIHIEIESGNSMRNKVARDLEIYFVTMNLGFYPKGNTSIGRFPDSPISIFTSKSNLMFTQDLINAIKPFIDCKYIIDTAFGSSDFIRFYINGTPTFSDNGSVKIE